MSRILIGVDVCKDFLDAHARPAGVRKTLRQRPRRHRTARRLGANPDAGARRLRVHRPLPEGSRRRPARRRLARRRRQRPPGPRLRQGHRTTGQDRRHRRRRPRPFRRGRRHRRASPAAQEVLEFRDLCDRRGQLVRMLAVEKNHRHAAQGASPKVQKNIDKHIAFLEATDRGSRGPHGPHRAESEAFKAKDAILQSIVGVGPQVSPPSWCICPSWARARVSRSPPSSAWPRSPTTAGPPAASATSAAAVARSASRCTRRRSPPSVTARP